MVTEISHTQHPTYNPMLISFIRKNYDQCTRSFYHLHDILWSHGTELPTSVPERTPVVGHPLLTDQLEARQPTDLICFNQNIQFARTSCDCRHFWGFLKQFLWEKQQSVVFRNWAYIEPTDLIVFNKNIQFDQDQLRLTTLFEVFLSSSYGENSKVSSFATGHTQSRLI